MTMPGLRAWFAFLSARLRHVRIINGDWTRALTKGVTKVLTVCQGGVCGIFLDPPYSAEAGRDMHLYTEESGDVAHAVREWCLAHGDDLQYRIVLAGFAGEGHEELEEHGWRCVEWFKPGFLKGGMAQLGTKRAREEEGEEAVAHQQGRERLWLNPHCLRADPPAQRELFDGADLDAR
jgi:hypothetical protein